MENIIFWLIWIVFSSQVWCHKCTAFQQAYTHSLHSTLLNLSNAAREFNAVFPTCQAMSCRARMPRVDFHLVACLPDKLWLALVCPLDVLIRKTHDIEPAPHICRGCFVLGGPFSQQCSHEEVVQVGWNKKYDDLRCQVAIYVGTLDELVNIFRNK